MNAGSVSTVPVLTIKSGPSSCSLAWTGSLLSKRLLHARVVFTSKCITLRAMLAQPFAARSQNCAGLACARTQPLPWVKTLRGDLVHMYKHPASHIILSDIMVSIYGSVHVPHPFACLCEGHATWQALMSHSRWEDAVSALFYVESRHDRTCPSPSSATNVHFCSICVQIPQSLKACSTLR